MASETYGHEGPLVDDAFGRHGEEEQDMLRCENCNCMVPADEPGELEEMDCGQFAGVLDAL